METNYKKLIVWQKSIKLVKASYVIIQNFPKHEQYALSDQVRRSAVSIPTNIAEWHQRNWNTNEFKHFLFISKWSAAEFETLMIIAQELWYINNDQFKIFEVQLHEILKMLSSLICSISKD